MHTQSCTSTARDDATAPVGFTTHFGLREHPSTRRWSASCSACDRGQCCGRVSMSFRCTASPSGQRTRGFTSGIEVQHRRCASSDSSQLTFSNSPSDASCGSCEARSWSSDRRRRMTSRWWVDLSQIPPLQKDARTFCLPARSVHQATAHPLCDQTWPGEVSAAHRPAVPLRPASRATGAFFGDVACRDQFRMQGIQQKLQCREPLLTVNDRARLHQADRVLCLVGRSAVAAA